MKKLLVVAALFVAAFVVAMPAQDQDKPPAPKFHRGGKQTPFLKIIESIKSGKSGIYRASTPPPSVVVVPKRLSMWGNSQYGVCVTSESCFSIADYSTYVGLDEIFVTEATAIRWAKDHGYLNGANLLEVIEDMQKDGIVDDSGKIRKAGKASSVDYSDENTLKSAIAQGPVSIAIDANALPSGAGNASGWSAFGGRSYPNTDHCVCLSGYGSVSELFRALNVATPSGAPVNGYLLFTWNTIGVVDHKWIMNTCVEAWVRNPTTTDLQPPLPPVTDVIVTVANVTGGVNTPVKFNPSAKGGTSPYIFLFEYGDGAQDAAGSHSYKDSGTYKVVVTAVDSTGKIGTAVCVASVGTLPPPGPNGTDTITLNIGGVTTVWEVFPLGTRMKLRDLIGPIAP